MSLDALVAIEQNVANIGLRHSGFPVELSIVVRLVKLLSWHVTSTGNAVLKTWGVTFAEYNVLTLLYGHRGHVMVATEMSGLIGETAAYTSRVIHQLHKRGLVIRGYDETDRRRVVVALSEAGERLVQDVLPVVSGVVNDFVRSHAPGEMAEFAGLLKRWLQGITA